MDTVQTEAHICARLDEMGIPYRKGVAGHGVVAVLEGQSLARCWHGPTVMVCL